MTYHLEAIHPHTGRLTHMTFTFRDARDTMANHYRRRRALWGEHADPWTVRVWDEGKPVTVSHVTRQPQAAR